MDAPKWVHLLPRGEIKTQDGRGPYRMGHVASLIRDSLPAGEKLVICENHATDIAGPRGEAAPARGWITALQERADGLWGEVEWTPSGRALMEEGAYRGISPVIAHQRDGRITAVLRASLTNTPNLQGLMSLHSALIVMNTHPDDLARRAVAYQSEVAAAGGELGFVEAVRLCVAGRDLACVTQRQSLHAKAPADSLDAAGLSQRATTYHNRQLQAGRGVSYAEAVRAVLDGRD